MAIGVYKYWDDANRLYQIALPDDFATALNYEVADGSEQYISASIAPRYCAYWNNTYSLSRLVVVPSKATFTNPPQTANADGLTWQLAGFYGEQFLALPNGNVQVIAGPQGPKGDQFTVDNMSAGMSADVAINASNTPFVLATLADVPTGTYFVHGIAQLMTGAAATRWTVEIGINVPVPGITTYYYSQSHYGATANQYYSVPVSGILPITYPSDFVLAAQASTTSTTAKKYSAGGSLVGTWLQCLKIA